MPVFLILRGRPEFDRVFKAHNMPGEHLETRDMQDKGKILDDTHLIILEGEGFALTGFREPEPQKRVSYTIRVKNDSAAVKHASALGWKSRSKGLRRWLLNQGLTKVNRVVIYGLIGHKEPVVMPMNLSIQPEMLRNLLNKTC